MASAWFLAVASRSSAAEELGMGMHMIEYRLRFRESATSRQRVRWWEIWEAPFGGKDRQLIGRTPNVLGDDDRADERLATAKNHAEAMLAGLRAHGS